MHTVLANSKEIHRQTDNHTHQPTDQVVTIGQLTDHESHQVGKWLINQLS